MREIRLSGSEGGGAAHPALPTPIAPGSCSGEFTSPDGRVKPRLHPMDRNDFPGAIQIVDLYHAGEHLWELARKLHRNDEIHPKRWIVIHQHKLDEGQIEKLVSSLRRYLQG